MLKSRRLGAQGLKVSEIGLGCMGMSQWYGARNDRESIATVHRSLDLGVDFFDSAEAYGPFTNEELLAKALKGRRDQAVIATKFGFLLRDGVPKGVDSRPEHIRDVVDASLKRLETDHIDLLYQHRFDPSIPIEEVVGVMAEMVEKGKVRFLGLCEVGEEVIRRANAVHPLSVVQAEYSVWERNLENDVLPTLRELDIGIVGFCPLGRGFLTGSVDRAENYPTDDFRYHDPRLQGLNYDTNMGIARDLAEIAAANGMTSAQLAIAWVLDRGEDIVPIPGTKRRRYLEENLGAAQLTLDDEMRDALATAIFGRQIAGPRYNEHMMAMINR